MRIETICTGDELLTGLTSDTNSRFFQTLLLEHGLTVRRSAVVGDRADDIIEELNRAVARCEFLLVSGGLGPTADDITAECAARASGVPLVLHAQVLAQLELGFAKRGLEMTPNNRRQAMVPQDAEVVLNAKGSAPLLIQRRGGCTLFFVPGVPREYRHLVEAHVVPRIVGSAKPSTVRALRVLKTFGLPESHLDERVRPLVAKHPHVAFGFRTHFPENHLKLMAEAPTSEQAQALLADAEADARPLLGMHLFGSDDDTLPAVVLEGLRRRHERLAVAESCTGGLISAELTAIPGASDVFFGAAVTYQDEAKTTWACVPPELLARSGAVCAEVASAMAEGICRITGASWGLSVTGYAGPGGGNALNPVGTVYVGMYGPEQAQVERLSLGNDRERTRRMAAYSALNLLRQALYS